MALNRRKGLKEHTKGQGSKLQSQETLKTELRYNGTTKL